MRTPAKFALWFFLLHTAANIFTIAWMALQTGGDYGEIQLRIFTRMMVAADWWILPFQAFHPTNDFINNTLADTIFRIWPTPNELAGLVTILFIPIGGAVYAAIGWLIGRMVEWFHKD